MIATLSGHSVAARRQWSDPRARALLLARQLLASERRRVDRLVESHLHLIEPAGINAARMTGLDRADMTQAAFLGLRRAAETFDPTKGAAFGTHAYWWMKAMCHEETYRMRSTIRYPKKPRSPIPKCSSLDVDDDEGGTLGSNIPDDDAPDRAAGLHRTELHDALASALGALAPRDALVVEMRFGINGAQRPHTLVEIAERVGVCSETCRRIEQRALAQLRDTLSNVEL
jgi:hypothetical protein